MFHTTLLRSLCSLALLLPCISASASVFYVHTWGDNQDAGTSWALAKRTIQAGIDAASAGDEVWVACGTYEEAVTLKNGVAIYSGFLGNETSFAQRDLRTYVAEINPSTSSSVVTCRDATDERTRVDGFLLRGGSRTSGYGGALDCVNSVLTLASCRVQGNSSGVLCSGSSPRLLNNVIMRNSGRAIECQSLSSPTIDGNIILGNNHEGIYCRTGTVSAMNNHITENGGYGIDAECSTLQVCGNTITGNASGGMKIFAPSGSVYDNVILWNNGGAGVTLSGGATLANNTIAWNVSTAVAGLGVNCVSGCSSRISNNVIAFNAGGISAYSAGSLTPVLTNNCVYQNGGRDYIALSPGVGDISADPKFAYPELGNVHIQPDSPCREAGDDSVVGADWKDMDLQPRSQDSHVDIGADESDGSTWPGLPRIVYVNASAPAGGDGKSWNTAHQTIRAGLEDVAMNGGAEVWVAAGTYVGQLVMPALTHLYGGFAGVETQRGQRNIHGNVTKISNPRDYWVQFQATDVYTASMSVLNGFSIDGPGGVWSSDDFALTISNNIITNPQYAAIGCTGGNPVIQCNVIAGCDTGITVDSGYSPTITANRITDTYDRAIDVHSSYGARLDRPVTVTNNLVCGNAGSGIYPAYQACTITNNTIINNQGAGINVPLFSTPATIENNIVAHNSVGVRVLRSGTTVSHNDVYGNGTDYEGIAPGSGDLSVDPKLVPSAELGVAYIHADSPCRNAGNPAARGLPETDIDGQPRTLDGVPDIGADESDGTEWPATPRRIYVDGSLTTGGDGSSWPNAYKAIGAAAADVRANGGAEIWTREGVYGEQVSLPTFAHLFGGFAGCENAISQREIAAHPTVIQGNKTSGYSAVELQPISRLDGVTVRDSSSGVRVRGGSTVVANCAITGCTHGLDLEYDRSEIRENSLSLNGIGICARFSQARIVKNSICNQAGTGIDTDRSALQARENTIGNNGGYGIYAPGFYDEPFAGQSYGIFERNTVRGNRDSGIYSSHSGIISNLAYNNGRAGIISGSGEIVNNTVSGNVESGLKASYSPTVINNIFAFNGKGIVSTSTPVLSNNDVYGNTVDYEGVTPGAGDCSVDPGFVDRAAGDYHLSGTSMCIDRGTTSVASLPAVDIDGEPRVSGWTADIGADEVPVEFTPSIGDAKRKPNGALAVLAGEPIVSYVYGSQFYVESPDRSMGISVQKANHGLTLGTKAHITGVLKTSAFGERYIDATATIPAGTGEVKPLGMAVRGLGGRGWFYDPVTQSGQQGVKEYRYVWNGSQWIRALSEAPGLHNIGILVSLVGKVTYVASNYFYLDDGSGAEDNSAYKGVRVIAPGLAMPVKDTYVKVIGVSCCFKSGSDLFRMVRASSITVLP